MQHDITSLWDRALSSERGIRVPLATIAEVHNTAMRLNQLRSKMREESKKVYLEGEIGFNQTPYDHIIIRKDLVTLALRMEFVTNTLFEVEDL